MFPARFLMVYSAYTPLFVIMAIRFTDSTAMWVCIVLAALGAASLLGLLRLERDINAPTHVASKVVDHGGEAISYLASYLLPFVTVGDPGMRDAIGYAVFFGVAVAVHLRSSAIQVNPLLFVFGYMILRVETEGGREVLLITKKRPHVGDEFAASEIDTDVLMSH